MAAMFRPVLDEPGALTEIADHPAEPCDDDNRSPAHIDLVDLVDRLAATSW